MLTPEDGEQALALFLRPPSPDLPHPPSSHVSSQVQGRCRGPDLADRISGFRSRRVHRF